MGPGIYLPPCIAATWEEGASGNTTSQCARLIVLYFKQWVHSQFQTKSPWIYELKQEIETKKTTATDSLSQLLKLEQGSLDEQLLKVILSQSGPIFEEFIEFDCFGFQTALWDWNLKSQKPLSEDQLWYVVGKAAHSHRSRPTCEELLKSPMGMNCIHADCEYTPKKIDLKKQLDARGPLEFSKKLKEGKLRAWKDDKEYWYCEILGGKVAYPTEKSINPIWVSDRKWDLLWKRWDLPKEEWQKFRLGVREKVYESAEPRKQPASDEDPKVVQAGEMILQNGDVLKFLIKQYNKIHVGDDGLGKGLFCSVMSSMSLSSEGIQPAANSEDPDMGKSDAVYAVATFIPPEHKIVSSVTAKTLFYQPNLKPGMILVADDVEWSDSLCTTVKRSMTKFQEPTQHMTIDKNLIAQTKEIPARFVWWFTSVDPVENAQVYSRQFPFDVDARVEHHTQINDSIKHRRTLKKRNWDEDFGIKVAKYIIKKLLSEGPYQVVIPFADDLQWRLPRGHRDLHRFLDLIDACAIMYHHQRRIEEGWIIAEYADFLQAKEIFLQRTKNIRTKLADTETRIVALMAEKDEWTQAELVERSGFKQPTVSVRLRSIMEKSNYIKSWKDGSERIYALTSKVDLNIFGNVIVDLAPPTDIDEDYELCDCCGKPHPVSKLKWKNGNYVCRKCSGGSSKKSYVA